MVSNRSHVSSPPVVSEAMIVALGLVAVVSAAAT